MAVSIINPADLHEYQRYALAAIHSPILKQWPAEYPTLSLLIFLLPLALPLPYPVAFGIFAGGALLVELAALPSGARWRLLGYTTLGALAVLEGRFDIFAATATLLGLNAALNRRWNAAWIWISVGLLLKVYPAVFLPLWFLTEWREKNRPPLARAAAVLGVSAMFLAGEYALAGPAALGPFEYFTHRPLEVGSFAGNVAALLHPFHPHIVFAFGSMNVASGMAGALSWIFTSILLVGMAWVWRELYRGAIDLPAASLFALTLLLLTSKVFSVQFILWLIPLWSLFPFNRWWLASALFSSAAYPFAYFYASAYPPAWPLAIALYFFRSLTLILGTLAIYPFNGLIRKNHRFDATGAEGKSQLGGEYNPKKG